MAPPPSRVQTAVRPPNTDPQSTSVSDPDSPDYDRHSPHYDSTLDRSSPNYVDRRGQVDTSAEVRDQAEDEVTAEDEAEDGWLRDLLERFTHNGRVDERYSDEMSAQAAQLAAHVETRPSPPFDAANYNSYEHEQLRSMVQDNVDPGGVGQTGTDWITTGNAMIQFQDEVAAAINNSETDWSGAAAAKARGFMADIGTWVGAAGQSAALAGTQMNLQSEALSTAGSSMPEEVPWNRDEWVQKIQTSNDPWSTYFDAIAQYQAHQEAKERAAQVVTTYDGSLAGASIMPAFTQPPTMAGDGTNPGDPGDGSKGKVGSTGGDFTGPGGSSGGGPGGFGGGGGGGGVVRPPTLPGGGSGTPGTPGGGSGGSGGSGGPGFPGLPGGSPGGTDPGGAGPGNPGGPGYPGYPGGGSGPGGGGHLPGGLPIGGGPIGGFPGGGGDYERGPGGRGGSGGYGPGGRGFGPGGGSASGFGTGSEQGGRSAGFGRGGVGAGGLGPGGAGGAGALAAEHAAGGGRGGLGGRGAGGMPMGGMGAGRGEGDEDGEHQRPAYLVEADPDSLFGTDQMTAPPVIGE